MTGVIGAKKTRSFTLCVAEFGSTVVAFDMFEVDDADAPVDERSDFSLGVTTAAEVVVTTVVVVDATVVDAAVVVDDGAGLIFDSFSAINAAFGANEAVTVALVFSSNKTKVTFPMLTAEADEAIDEVEFIRESNITVVPLNERGMRERIGMKNILD